MSIVYCIEIFKSPRDKPDTVYEGLMIAGMTESSKKIHWDAYTNYRIIKPQDVKGTMERVSSGNGVIGGRLPESKDIFDYMEILYKTWFDQCMSSGYSPPVFGRRWIQDPKSPIGHIPKIIRPLKKKIKGNLFVI